ncbi:MAG: 2-hydroxyacyl-CoA dehydratase [Chloroflexi bacterium]|nr:2-hydroxyacyl-CoA dehydratase [Chloroflexota bacterium]
MTQQTSHKRWQTRPLQCWDKAKEIRRNYEKDGKEAGSKGVLLVHGRELALFGLPDVRSITDNPLGAMIGNTSDPFSRACRAECEIRGYGRDICGYFRNTFGSMYLNRDVWGGEFPRRDLSVGNSGVCDCHTKQLQPVSEHFGGPLLSTDHATHVGPVSDERAEVGLEYLVAQTQDQIEYLENATGKKFDDEYFAEATKHFLRIRAIAREVILMNRSIPAPLDQKSFHSFMALGGRVRASWDDIEALWKMLRDEVKYRVDNQIAAVATERYRWLEDQPPPWYFLKYYRYMEKYGTVCIGSPYTHAIGGFYDVGEDGTFEDSKTPLELGWPMNTREDIIRASLGGVAAGSRGDFAGRSKRMVAMAKAFHCDGALIPLARAGCGCLFGMREAAGELIEAGIPTMCYEYSQPGDRTAFDENRMLDQLDAFMESQGLQKLDD